jgi:GntR family transcriptional regulator / MocR family aminotransferase
MEKNRSNFGPVADLLLALDRDGTEPLHRQIATSIRDDIRDGRLRRGSALPPTRTLAAGLNVSRGVVVEAYQQLRAEGYLSSKSGGYTEVAAEQIRPAQAAEQPDERTAQSAPRISFRYGRADLAHFPRTAWLRSVNRALTDAPAERFGYLTGQGVPELRQALADYLNRVRGTAAAPRDVVVCNGFAQGINLLIQVLAEHGKRRLAVEDPSPADELRQQCAQAGIDLVPVPVGPDGLRTEVLDRSSADAVLVTPSHQWPTGAVLSSDNRSALLRWAADPTDLGGDRLIIEDDYDAEYRYDRAPVGALHGLDPEHVVYTGTASKTLAPGLRLGWLILPGRLVEPVAAAKIAADRGSPVIDQLAFADFLSRGEFDRHLRRMRPVYRRRRDTLLSALAQRLPELTPDGICAGFHLIAWLPPGLDEQTVVQAAARRGVGVYGLAPHRMTPGPPGLLFGYAGLSEPSIAEGVALLARAISDLSG